MLRDIRADGGDGDGVGDGKDCRDGGRDDETLMC